MKKCILLASALFSMAAIQSQAATTTYCSKGKTAQCTIDDAKTFIIDNIRRTYTTLSCGQFKDGKLEEAVVDWGLDTSSVDARTLSASTISLLLCGVDSLASDQEFAEFLALVGIPLDAILRPGQEGCYREGTGIIRATTFSWDHGAQKDQVLMMRGDVNFIGTQSNCK